MATVTEHYDTHLADLYSWVLGGVGANVDENERFFDRIGARPSGSRRALDVGAGTGFQSVALARLGFDVTAVDLSERLLDELRRNAAGLHVEAVHADILGYIPSAPESGFELCVCMGDTLTHLASFGDVQRLVRGVHRVLDRGGIFVVAFRDFTRELRGLDRFIPVKSDASTLFTCFLEYEGDHVLVHDIIQRRDGDSWQMKKSVYRKLRLPPDSFRKRLDESGFDLVSIEMHAGLDTLVARKR
jgi:SAM-dependent methyltransferase